MTVCSPSSSVNSRSGDIPFALAVAEDGMFDFYMHEYTAPKVVFINVQSRTFFAASFA